MWFFPAKATFELSKIQESLPYHSRHAATGINNDFTKYSALLQVLR